jgi:hypothetical protein
MFDPPTWLVIASVSAVCAFPFAGIGMAIGYQLGRRTSMKSTVLVTAPPPIHCVQDVEACRRSGALLVERIRVLAELTFTNRQMIPPGWHSAVEELVEAVRTVRRQIEQLAKRGVETSPTDNRLPRSFQATDSGQPDTIRSDDRGESATRQSQGSAPDLTSQEIQSLTTLAGDPAEETAATERHRYRYDCFQTIYRWYDAEQAPSIAPGITVRCHDVSTKGISFFLPESPDFQRLIVALGAQDRPVFMWADVMYSKVVYMYGQVGYLVGCKFIARLPGFSQQFRVRFNKRRKESAVDLIAPANARQAMREATSKVPPTLLA